MNYLALKKAGSRLVDPYSIMGAVEEKQLTSGQKSVVGGVITVASLAGLGTTIYLLAKAKYLWAVMNFFVFTPAALMAVGAVAVGVVAASKPKELS